MIDPEDLEDAIDRINHEAAMECARRAMIERVEQALVTQVAGQILGSLRIYPRDTFFQVPKPSVVLNV